MQRQIGIVKRYDPKRRFGFVRPDNAERDVFLYAGSCYQFDPAVGDRVSFVVGSDHKGPAAKDVRIISYAD
jgi:cold shock CspA family protein